MMRSSAITCLYEDLPLRRWIDWGIPHPERAFLLSASQSAILEFEEWMRENNIPGALLRTSPSGGFAYTPEDDNQAMLVKMRWMC